MDSLEFTYWQAMYKLEPWGGLVADQRHGDATSVLANGQWGSDKKWFKAEDFMFGSDARSPGEDVEPVLLEDAVAQSNLIRATMFGLPPKLKADEGS